MNKFKKALALSLTALVALGSVACDKGEKLAVRIIKKLQY